MTVELNGWSFECVEDSTGELYLRSRAKNSREAGVVRGSLGKKIKHALLAAAVFSALLAATLPLAHTAWLKWPVDFGTTAISDDLVEARALTKEACGDSSQWGQVLCQNAKGIVSALERHAP
jgi:hypothetical protein